MNAILGKKCRQTRILPENTIAKLEPNQVAKSDSGSMCGYANKSSQASLENQTTESHITTGGLNHPRQKNIIDPSHTQNGRRTMSDDLKDNIKKQSTWKRGLYILLFSIFYGIAEFVMYMIIIFQFLLKLFTDETNERLRKLSQGISTYIYQILQFMNFNSDVHPYPFGAWPKGEPKPVAKKVIAGDASEETK